MKLRSRMISDRLHWESTERRHQKRSGTFDGISEHWDCGEDGEEEEEEEEEAVERNLEIERKGDREEREDDKEEEAG